MTKLGFPGFPDNVTGLLNGLPSLSLTRPIDALREELEGRAKTEEPLAPYGGVMEGTGSRAGFQKSELV